MNNQMYKHLYNKILNVPHNCYIESKIEAFFLKHGFNKKEDIELFNEIRDKLVLLNNTLNIFNKKDICNIGSSIIYKKEKFLIQVWR